MIGRNFLSHLAKVCIGKDLSSKFVQTLEYIKFMREVQKRVSDMF